MIYPPTWPEETRKAQATHHALIEVGVEQWKIVWGERARQREKTDLPPGMRYLSCHDRWQDGDEYDGIGTGKEWWKGPGHGVRVNIGMLCYTPRGSTKRRPILLSVLDSLVWKAWWTPREETVFGVCRLWLIRTHGDLRQWWLIKGLRRDAKGRFVTR